MQDRLEKFIRENKEEFDVAEPQDRVWKNIEKGLNEEKATGLWSAHWYWKVAVAVLLIAVAYLGYDKLSYDTPQKEQASILKEFEELETFYTTIIAEKKLELSEEVSEEDFFNYLEADIQSLDDLYSELKTTFEENQETPQVKSALVHLLRQKLHLINKQLDILETMKSPSSVKAEGTSSL